MGLGLGCDAEPHEGSSVQLAAKICFMLRPFYALCDKDMARICLKIGHFMVEVTGSAATGVSRTRSAPKSPMAVGDSVAQVARSNSLEDIHGARW
jgi:hypothetical protein